MKCCVQPQTISKCQSSCKSWYFCCYLGQPDPWFHEKHYWSRSRVLWFQIPGLWSLIPALYRPLIPAISMMAFEITIFRGVATIYARTHVVHYWSTPVINSCHHNQSNKMEETRVCLSVLILVFLYPVSTCAAERSFSGMRVKRLKTPPPSTMSEERLSSLAILHMDKHKNVDIDNVLSEFSRRKGRRLTLFL